ncbi:MAG: hypothetical protein ACRDTC_02725, partial [Pseudonocardiaceae bacterium]
MASDKSYSTSLRHVLAELARLDLLLRIQVWRLRQCKGTPDDELSAFYIPDAEVDALLDKPVGVPIWAVAPPAVEVPENAVEQWEQLGIEIAERVTDSVRQGVYLRLPALAELFDLAPFDVDVVVMCLALEIDRCYERFYGYLHDDITRRSPTVDLIINLRCADLESKVAARTRFTPQAPLIRHHLITLAEDPTP